MAKLILAVSLAGTGVFFWHYPVVFAYGIESVSLATVLWLSALLLFLLSLLQLSARGPWQ
jgi:hypothetical protein